MPAGVGFERDGAIGRQQRPCVKSFGRAVHRERVPRNPSVGARLMAGPSVEGGREEFVEFLAQLLFRLTNAFSSWAI